MNIYEEQTNWSKAIDSLNETKSERDQEIDFIASIDWDFDEFKDQLLDIGELDEEDYDTIDDKEVIERCMDNGLLDGYQNVIEQERAKRNKKNKRK